ncbi:MULTISPECIES: hypothetical protein [Dictyoglomus]|uniref:hypothetical protein n=1 Tax=Dictyoglomus TaxID=13 RepID=UPI0001828708|nr:MULTISPECIES: hypothetical protein [Dictyoglomus]HBU31360.1 hypothetical protein [Dictyoglomus sp.]
MKEVSTERLNRALSLLSKVNQNLLKIEREEEVFSKVPRIIENIEGYIVCILIISSKDSPFKVVLKMKDPVIVEGFENIIKECSGVLPKSLISKINEKKISSAIFSFPCILRMNG